jgi:hypothetical protein
MRTTGFAMRPVGGFGVMSATFHDMQKNILYQLLQLFDAG